MLMMEVKKETAAAALKFDYFMCSVFPDLLFS